MAQIDLYNGYLLHSQSNSTSECWTKQVLWIPLRRLLSLGPGVGWQMPGRRYPGTAPDHSWWEPEKITRSQGFSR